MCVDEHPSNHSYWNKYGAAMANSEQHEPAFRAYEQSLRIRPNYVRSYVNIAVSYLRTGRAELACKYFLNALMLNPNLKYLWLHVRTGLHICGKEHLVADAHRDNPSLFKPHFDLI
jgi:tetratricopeptide (TPR) repeat protein